MNNYATLMDMIGQYIQYDNVMLNVFGNYQISAIITEAYGHKHSEEYPDVISMIMINKMKGNDNMEIKRAPRTKTILTGNDRIDFLAEKISRLNAGARPLTVDDYHDILLNVIYDNDLVERINNNYGCSIYVMAQAFSQSTSALFTFEELWDSFEEIDQVRIQLLGLNAAF